jgi:hypothetical protein
MDAFRDFDETAALSSFGLTRGQVVRMIAREPDTKDALTERGRSYYLGGDRCALESQRNAAVALANWVCGFAPQALRGAERLSTPRSQSES